MAASKRKTLPSLRLPLSPDAPPRAGELAPAPTEEPEKLAALIDAVEDFFGQDEKIAEPTHGRLARALMLSAAKMAQLQREVDEARRRQQDLVRVASHDLREPVIMMGNCADMLTPAELAGLASAQRTALQHVRAGSVRLSALLAALTETWQVDIDDRPHQVVDTGALVDAAARGASRTYEGVTPAFVHRNLPHVHGNRSQLARLFEELFDNAVRFRRDPRPLVEVRAHAVDARWRFEVSDDGQGPPPELGERAFAPCVRAGRPRGPVGHGMGLALVAAIVRRHGGRVAMTPREGRRGSRVVFDLPAV